MEGAIARAIFNVGETTAINIALKKNRKLIFIPRINYIIFLLFN